MTDSPNSIELAECLRYAGTTAGEEVLSSWNPAGQPPALLIPEGFEERSLGILQHFSQRNIRVPRIVIARYANDGDLNKQYRSRFEALANELAPGAWDIVDNHDNGDWVREALLSTKGFPVALDVTGLSSRGIFGALDALSHSPVNAMIMYSEADQYWPKIQDWELVKKTTSTDLSNDGDLADRADASEWLYDGRSFHVELIQGHEGYDVAGTSALIAFLPFKSARLAAVMNHAEYSQYAFIAGKPRLTSNAWRLEALKQINSMATRDWPVEEMSTFSYRDALRQLAKLLFSCDSLSNRCDIHIAPMGSKLQTIACWALSRITRAVTMVTAVPSRYFSTAYSEGIGCSWGFPFIKPEISNI